MVQWRVHALVVHVQQSQTQHLKRSLFIDRGITWLLPSWYDRKAARCPQSTFSTTPNKTTIILMKYSIYVKSVSWATHHQAHPPKGVFSDFEIPDLWFDILEVHFLQKVPSLVFSYYLLVYPKWAFVMLYVTLLDRNAFFPPSFRFSCLFRHLQKSLQKIHLFSRHCVFIEKSIFFPLLPFSLFLQHRLERNQSGL